MVEKFGIKRIKVPKIFFPIKIGSIKWGSKMIKAVKRLIWNMFKMFPGTYLQSLVKIGSVAAEIFLIWTNFARTNFAWTNVTVTVGIC